MAKLSDSSNNSVDDETSDRDATLVSAKAQKADLETPTLRLRKSAVVACVIALSPVSATAETFTYICHVGGKSPTVVIDDVKNTLRWSGKTYKIGEQEKCAKSGWRAEREGDAFNFCTATKGSAYFQRGDSYEDGSVQCDLQHAPSAANFALEQGAKKKLGQSDKYAGCVFSVAIPLMHNGTKLDNASVIAYRRCDAYSRGLTETELEGVSDYVNVVLENVDKIRNPR